MLIGSLEIKGEYDWSNGLEFHTREAFLHCRARLARVKSRSTKYNVEPSPVRTYESDHFKYVFRNSWT